MNFELGLIKKQHGGDFPIGSYWNMVSLSSSIKQTLSACQLPTSNSFIDFKSYNTSVKPLWTFDVFNTFILNAKVRPIRHHELYSACVNFYLFLVWRYSAETSQELFGFSPCTGEQCHFYACFNHYYLANTICDWFHPALIKHFSLILHENWNNQLTFVHFQPEFPHLSKSACYNHD